MGVNLVFTMNASGLRAFHREMSPPGFQGWGPDEKIGLERTKEGRDFERAKEAFEVWKDGVAKMNLLFKEHIHDNPNPTQWDFRQHRARLHRAIGAAEMFALALLQGQPTEEALRLAGEVDAETQKLAIELAEWHTPIEASVEIPAGLKKSFKQVDAGNLVAFDFEQRA